MATIIINGSFFVGKKQGGKVKIMQEIVVDPSTPASDQNRASYIINPMPGRQVMTIKTSRRGSVVDPLHNSPFFIIIVWQTLRRITYEILGMKGWKR